MATENSIAAATIHDLEPEGYGYLISLKFDHFGDARHACRIEDEEHVHAWWRDFRIGRCRQSQHPNAAASDCDQLPCLSLIESLCCRSQDHQDRVRGDDGILARDFKRRAVGGARGRR
jgi:hypothetical protein